MKVKVYRIYEKYASSGHDHVKTVRTEAEAKEEVRKIEQKAKGNILFSGAYYFPVEIEVAKVETYQLGVFYVEGKMFTPDKEDGETIDQCLQRAKKYAEDLSVW